MTKLWRFEIITSGKLSDCERLLELPYSTNFNVGDPIATCFVEGTKEDAEIAVAAARQMGYDTREITEVPNENWVAKCSAMWAPVNAKGLNIIPVIDQDLHASSTAISSSKNDLFIVPGSGFGTGHHPSTFAALCLMQDSRVLAAKPHIALDVGAGSAILSIAAVKLYGCHAYAYDVDQHALDNAESCIALNPGTRSGIDLVCSTLPADAPTGDIILANIYGEVLIELAELFKSKLLPGGHLILAGITTEIALAVQQRFEELEFEKLEHLTNAEWNAFLFKKA
jgi:ribosomal protein L11 methyltransferase